MWRWLLSRPAPDPASARWEDPGQSEPAGGSGPSAPRAPAPVSDWQKGPGSVNYQREMTDLEPCQSSLTHVRMCSCRTELTRGESAFP